MTTQLVQIILPLYDNSGRVFGRDLFATTLGELTETFGGATAFTRAPAEGFWESPGGQVKKDDVVVIEVQVEELDGSWWRAYGVRLEQRFDQDTVLMRALPCRTL